MPADRRYEETHGATRADARHGRQDDHAEAGGGVLHCLSGPTIGWAQGTSIEELEQKIQKAKEEKARRDAAAAKANADAARAASERKTQESRLATVVVQSDAPCALSMNGDPLGNIPAGISKHQ